MFLALYVAFILALYVICMSGWTCSYMLSVPPCFLIYFYQAFDKTTFYLFGQYFVHFIAVVVIANIGCGYPTVPIKQTRIVGGYEARQGSLPWMVRISYLNWNTRTNNQEHDTIITNVWYKTFVLLLFSMISTRIPNIVKFH